MLQKKSAMKYQWTKEADEAFQQIKKVISDQVMLTFPKFGEPFDIYTDASDCQLGAVISQNGKPIAFYSRKLTPTQKRYTVGEREALSIVETLKEFKNILLGQDITVHTDHMNLVNPTTQHESSRVIRWRWLIEEFGPKFEYVKGHKNVVADALSRMDADHLESYNLPDGDEDIEETIQTERPGNYPDDKITPEYVFPIAAAILKKHQKEDLILQQNIKRHPQYFSKTTYGMSSNAVELVTFHKKIYVPPVLRPQVLKWYHNMLGHPGEQRTERTIRQNLVWPGLQTAVAEHIAKCHECQIYKTHRKKYGKLPLKQPDEKPWNTICVDLIGPYDVTTQDEEELTLNAMTICDPVTGWFEIIEIPNKSAKTAARKLNQAWLTRYPRPERCIFDNGNEFLGKDFQDQLETHGIKAVPTTVKNPQANYVERVHQTLGNILRTKALDKYKFDYEDPWSDILAQAAWAIRSTVHTLYDATPGQLVFGRDMIYDLSFKPEWDKLLQKRQSARRTNNERENKSRTDYQYKVGDKVLINRDVIQRKLLPKRDGPYEVVRIYDNGTIKLRKGIVVQRINIRRLQPYHSL
jgi:hypothetical protein